MVQVCVREWDAEEGEPMMHRAPVSQRSRTCRYSCGWVQSRAYVGRAGWAQGWAYSGRAGWVQASVRERNARGSVLMYQSIPEDTYTQVERGTTEKH